MGCIRTENIELRCRVAGSLDPLGTSPNIESIFVFWGTNLERCIDVDCSQVDPPREFGRIIGKITKRIRITRKRISAGRVGTAADGDKLNLKGFPPPRILFLQIATLISCFRRGSRVASVPYPN